MFVVDFPSRGKVARKQDKKTSRTRRLRGGRSSDYDTQIDLATYLHKDKIKEIMNIEGLEESLDEVLTITGSEMDEMFNSRGTPRESVGQYHLKRVFKTSESNLMKGEDKSMRSHVSKDDLYNHQERAEFDDLLKVPELEHVGTVKDEDMERMMKISEEMLDLDLNLQQADLDCLLNVDIFTEKQSPAVSL